MCACVRMKTHIHTHTHTLSQSCAPHYLLKVHLFCIYLHSLVMHNNRYYLTLSFTYRMYFDRFHPLRPYFVSSYPCCSHSSSQRHTPLFPCPLSISMLVLVLMSFIRIVYMNMGQGLFTVVRARYTTASLLSSGNC